MIQAAPQSWGAPDERVSQIFAVQAGQCRGGGPVPGRAFGRAWDFLPVSEPDWRAVGPLPFESIKKRAQPGSSFARGLFRSPAGPTGHRWLGAGEWCADPGPRRALAGTTKPRDSRLLVAPVSCG